MYSRKVVNQTLTFGVSGLLYKSNVLMYDHQTESLWSQVKRRAVTGQMTDTRLKVLPSTLTTWKKWRTQHPDTEVLSLATGHIRDYSKDPYEGYYKSRSGLFGFFKGGPDAEEKELVVGVTIGEVTRAYKLSELRAEGVIEDTVAEQNITLTFDMKTDHLNVTNSAGQTIDYMIVYWFVWKDIYPEATVFKQL